MKLYNKNTNENINISYTLIIKDLNDLIVNKDLGEINIDDDTTDRMLCIFQAIINKNPHPEDYLFVFDIDFIYHGLDYMLIESLNTKKFIGTNIKLTYKNTNKINLNNIITNHKFEEIASSNMEDEILNYVIWKNKDADLSKDKLSIKIISKGHAKIIPKEGTDFYIGSHDIEYIDYNEEMNLLKKNTPHQWYIEILKIIKLKHMILKLMIIFRKWK